MSHYKKRESSGDQGLEVNEPKSSLYVIVLALVSATNDAIQLY